MNPRDQAEADRLIKIITDKAREYEMHPEAGLAAGYRPKGTVTTSTDLLSAGPAPHVQRDIFFEDWLAAVAKKHLAGWRWTIDKVGVSVELEILSRLP
ncbi:hypothetical protein MHZ93_05080 [Roseomonas sp. ACRSG]|nr:hypothetical protein [Roseomonas sp. ACRSG]